MSTWTPRLVEGRLAEAASVLERLPAPRRLDYFNTWPAYFHDFSDLVGQAPQPMRISPSPAAISRMEETLGWLVWLEPEDAKLVWMRAERARWRAICLRFGIARATAHRRWQYALCVIVWRLDKRPLPRKWSRRFLRERVRTLSDAA